MSLLEALDQGGPTPRPAGKIQALLARLEGEELALVKSRIEGSMSAEDLSAALARAGEPIGTTTIRLYRRNLRREEGTA